jgi:hypothetical protein
MVKREVSGMRDWGKPVFLTVSDSGLSRLKRPWPYPVVFRGVIFCLAGRMGEFAVKGHGIDESRIFEMWHR